LLGLGDVATGTQQTSGNGMDDAGTIDAGQGDGVLVHALRLTV